MPSMIDSNSHAILQIRINKKKYKSKSYCFTFFFSPFENYRTVYVLKFHEIRKKNWNTVFVSWCT